MQFIYIASAVICALASTVALVVRREWHIFAWILSAIICVVPLLNTVIVVMTLRDFVNTIVES
jgi:hypothetical protein